MLPQDETASLIVRYRGNGRGKPMLMLAHMDVVTANPEDWQRDPFTLIEENGYFFGRGTADIKGDVALVTTHVPAPQARGLQAAPRPRDRRSRATRKRTRTRRAT